MKTINMDNEELHSIDAELVEQMLQQSPAFQAYINDLENWTLNGDPDPEREVLSIVEYLKD